MPQTRDEIAAEAAQIKQSLMTPWGIQPYTYFTMGGGMHNGRIDVNRAEKVYKRAIRALELLEEALKLAP